MADLVLLSKVVVPALAQAEKAFSAALSRISVEDLTHSAEGLRKVGNLSATQPRVQRSARRAIAGHHRASSSNFRRPP